MWIYAIDHWNNNTLVGGAEGEEFLGGDGNDVIVTGGGDDTVQGQNHDDILFGEGGSDFLQGGAGRDKLDGGAGFDELSGGSGDDRLYFSGEDVYDGGADFDTFDASGIGYILAGWPAYANVTYGPASQGLRIDTEHGVAEVRGTGAATENFYISSRLGIGLGDAEFISIENYELTGFGDYIAGSDAAEEIHGNDGDDIIEGRGGADTIFGDQGSDTVEFGSAETGVNVDLGRRTGLNGTGLIGTGLIGDAEGDVYISIENVRGSHFLDALYGDEVANTILGRGGDDFLEGRGGADVLDGGEGIDTVLYGSSAVGVSVNLAVTTAEQGGDAAGDILRGIENVSGSAFDDVLHGDGGANRLVGNGGADELNGRGGDDQMHGGSQNDTYWVDSAGDEVFESANQGTDAVNVSGLQTYTLTANVENLTLSTGVNGTGNALQNRITGNILDNILDGAGGADTMEGRQGNDTFRVDNAADAVIELANQGNDTVLASVSYALGAGISVETLATTNDAGTVAINLTGNTSGNNIIGNNGANTLNGGGGDDGFAGRGGDDTYIVDSLSDTITENGGQGIDTVRSSVTYTLTAGADVELLATTNDAGTAAIKLTGNANGNEVRGNNGTNVLNGGDGNDTLTGLGGQDSFLFSTALNAASNVDDITDFNVAADTIQLDDAVFSAFTPGAVAAGRIFAVGFGSQGSDDNIVYDRNTGALFYDSDGAGGAGPIQFAEVTPFTALTALDFLVV